MVALFFIVVIVVIIVVRARKKTNLREKFANNQLIQDYIERKSSEFIDKIQHVYSGDSIKDIKVGLYIQIYEKGIDKEEHPIDKYHSSYIYAVDFKQNHLRPLEKVSERQLMAEAISAGILQRVKSEMPINSSHSNPKFKVTKDNFEISPCYLSLDIVYTATNKNYIEPKPW